MFTKAPPLGRPHRIRPTYTSQKSVKPSSSLLENDDGPLTIIPLTVDLEDVSSRWSHLSAEFWSPSPNHLCRRLSILEFIGSQLNLRPNIFRELNHAQCLNAVGILICSLHLPIPLNLPAIPLLSRALHSIDVTSFSLSNFAYLRPLKDFCLIDAKKLLGSDLDNLLKWHVYLICIWSFFILGMETEDSSFSFLAYSVPFASDIIPSTPFPNLSSVTVNGNYTGLVFGGNLCDLYSTRDSGDVYIGCFTVKINVLHLQDHVNQPDVDSGVCLVVYNSHSTKLPNYHVFQPTNSAIIAKITFNSEIDSLSWFVTKHFISNTDYSIDLHFWSVHIYQLYKELDCPFLKVVQRNVYDFWNEIPNFFKISKVVLRKFEFIEPKKDFPHHKLQIDRFVDTSTAENLIKALYRNPCPSPMITDSAPSVFSLGKRLKTPRTKTEARKILESARNRDFFS
ncbi:hypothetical protein P9112_002532 [Eukaryota sp. TZLM1-RC]